MFHTEMIDVTTHVRAGSDPYTYLERAWVLERIGYPHPGALAEAAAAVFKHEPERRDALLDWVWHVPHPALERAYGRLLSSARMGRQLEALWAMDVWWGDRGRRVFLEQHESTVLALTRDADPRVALAAAVQWGTHYEGGAAAWARAAVMLRALWRDHAQVIRLERVHAAPIGLEPGPEGRLDPWQRAMVAGHLRAMGEPALDALDVGDVARLEREPFSPTLRDVRDAWTLARRTHVKSARVEDDAFFTGVLAGMLAASPAWAERLDAQPEPWRELAHRACTEAGVPAPEHVAGGDSSAH